MIQKNIFLIMGVTVLLMGCSPKTEAETSQPIKENTVEIEITTEQEESSVSQTVPEETVKKEVNEESKETEADDNFAVEASEAEAFACQVKEVVAGKNLDALADLAAYPLYVGFPDGGKSIESKEDFVALGGETVFTEELMDSVAQANESELSPSRAGFVLTREAGDANIVFGLRNGELAISGINY